MAETSAPAAGPTARLLPAVLATRAPALGNPDDFDVWLATAARVVVLLKRQQDDSGARLAPIPISRYYDLTYRTGVGFRPHLWPAHKALSLVLSDFAHSPCQDEPSYWKRWVNVNAPSGAIGIGDEVERALSADLIGNRGEPQLPSRIDRVRELRSVQAHTAAVDIHPRWRDIWDEAFQQAVFTAVAKRDRVCLGYVTTACDPDISPFRPWSQGIAETLELQRAVCGLAELGLKTDLALMSEAREGLAAIQRLLPAQTPPPAPQPVLPSVVRRPGSQRGGGDGTRSPAGPGGRTSPGQPA